MLKLSKISAIAAVALAPLLALCAAGNQTEPAKGSEKLKIAVFVRNMTDDKSIDAPRRFRRVNFSQSKRARLLDG